MGESMIISSTATPVASSFLAPYGPALQQRPRPTFRGVVAAAGGALVGIGVGAIAGLWLTLVALAVDTNVLSDAPTQVFQKHEDWSLSLAVGVVYLLSGLVFDRKGRAGFSTPFFAIGDIAFYIGVTGTVSQIDGVGGPLLVVLASLALTFVGGAGGRRLTTWLGGGGVVIGSLTLTAQLLDTDKVVPNALLILVFGVALLALVFAMSTARVSEDLAAPSVAETDDATEPMPSGEH